jgi:citrate lyase beta subunit
MNDIKVIQYLPLTHPRATLRLVKRLNAAGVMSILDLEDSAQDPFDKDKTRDLKINARNNFLELVNSKTWEGDEFSRSIYIRVNSNKTNFFKDDIKAVLNIFNSGFPISGIFLPKVESTDQIQEAHSLIGQHTSPNNQAGSLEIIPMIETASGMENLAEMLESDKNRELFSKIHYGHFDYCLDANLWPFPDPNQDSFWSLVEPMISLILSYNKTYIHTPFPFPYNIDLFWASSRHLLNLFPNRDIWACTLNSELSLSEESDDLGPLKIVTCDTSSEHKEKEAKIIQEHFLAGRANRRSFGISNNRFIPPHQFFAAEEYLKNIKEE